MSAQRDERFAEMLETTQAHVRAYIAGLGVPPVDVDDLAQEVYLEVYRNMEAIPADLEPIRWLKGIARNLCMNHFRRETRRKLKTQLESLIEHLDRTPATFDDVEAMQEALRALDGCMEQLSEKNREMIRMRYRDGRTSESIAEAFATTAEAVRITLFRLRGKLKECVTRRLEPHG
ncbi:MAG: sigma-70 family RNA polymerase sigma factor [Planctomycetota bacterium]|nr:sigma-70 family RNA polymerase sigma factor [Planctomycetota bacterium]